MEFEIKATLPQWLRQTTLPFHFCVRQWANVKLSSYAINFKAKCKQLPSMRAINENPSMAGQPHFSHFTA